MYFCKFNIIRILTDVANYIDDETGKLVRHYDAIKIRDLKDHF